jgi:multiple sugar transport system ATP-binding protein
MTLGDRLVVMAGGVIQQIGAPLEVYREPVNRFVAGFLGSPSMNFIEGRLEKHDGDVRFTDGRDVRLPVRGAWSSRATGHVGRAIVAGVRPESLRFDGGEGHGVLPIEVRVTEPLGDRMDVYGTTDAGTAIVARVEPEASCKAGDRIALTFDPAAVHLFEPGEFGRRL